MLIFNIHSQLLLTLIILYGVYCYESGFGFFRIWVMEKLGRVCRCWYLKTNKYVCWCCECCYIVKGFYCSCKHTCQTSKRSLNQLFRCIQVILLFKIMVMKKPQNLFHITIYRINLPFLLTHLACAMHVFNGYV